MWEKDNSDWSKEQGYTRHDYHFDDDCSFCKSHGGYSCNGSKKACRTVDERLIIFLFPDLKNDLFYVWLYSAVPYRNKFGEREDVISFTVDRMGQPKEQNTKVCLKFEGCNYNSHNELDLTDNEMEELLQEIPLFKEADAPLESVFGKLNFFDGSREEWIQAYQDKFEELKVRITKKGHLKEPDI